MQKIIPGLLVLGLFAAPAWAAPVTLKCAGPDLGPHYFPVWVDYDAKTATVGKQDTMTPSSAAAPAAVSEGEVNWDVTSPGGDKYHYRLDRKSGAITVTGDNYESGDVTCKAP